MIRYGKYQASWVCEKCDSYEASAYSSHEFFRPDLCRQCGSHSREFKYAVWRWMKIKNINTRIWWWPPSWYIWIRE